MLFFQLMTRRYEHASTVLTTMVLKADGTTLTGRFDIALNASMNAPLDGRHDH